MPSKAAKTRIVRGPRRPRPADARTLVGLIPGGLIAVSRLGAKLGAEPRGVKPVKPAQDAVGQAMTGPGVTPAVAPLAGVAVIALPDRRPRVPIAMPICPANCWIA